MTLYAPIFIKVSDRADGKPSWNDPRRQIYPHHAEFWPEDVPETVVFVALQEAQAREARRRLLRRFFLRIYRSMRIVRRGPAGRGLWTQKAQP